MTARILAESGRASPGPVAELKRELLDRGAYGPVSLRRMVELTAERYPGSRVSERVALCEQAAWELLHEGAVGLIRAGAPVDREDWQGVLLRWEAWTGERRDDRVRLGPGDSGDEVVDQPLALGLRAEQVAVDPQQALDVVHVVVELGDEQQPALVELAGQALQVVSSRRASTW